MSIADLPRPRVGAHDVLVKVCAATVSTADWRIRSATAPAGFGLPMRLAFGVRRPRQRVLGTDAAGPVEAVGPAVSRWRVGDRVLVQRGAGMGCHAEYLCVAESAAVVPIPDRLAFEEAAALPFGGGTALYFLRDLARVRPGERVLVNGASGSVGTAAVQLARHFGAVVTGVCGPANAELVRSLGAQRVIDHTAEDFARAGGTYDVILDTVGNCPIGRCREVLADGGRLLLVVATLGQTLGATLRPARSGHRVLAGTAPERAADLRFLVDRAVAGGFRPVIDRVYPFERVAEAHARVETGRKRSNVLLRLVQADDTRARRATAGAARRGLRPPPRAAARALSDDDGRSPLSQP